jgi:RNA polymerase sigma-70 factor (ECF subfamily)
MKKIERLAGRHRLFTETEGTNVLDVSDEGELLLEEMSRGSVTAFEKFYQKYAAFVLHVAWNMTGSRLDAEDLCHDVLLEAWNDADKYEAARGSVEAWLAVRTKSRCTDYLRRKRRWHEKASIVAGSFVQPQGGETEEAALARVAWAYLRSALKQIPPFQRQAVYGAYVEELTHRELAKRMNKPLGTIKSFVRNGLKHLRKQLDAAGWTASSGGDKR